MVQPALITKDKGYAWFVAFGVTLGTFIGDGIATADLSLYVHTWIHDLGITEQEAGWVSAILPLVLLLPGPIYSLVVSAVGTWQCQLIATLLMLAGYLVISFATELWHVFVGFSVLIGLGSAVSLICCTKMIETYFDIHKDRVWTIMYSAFGVSKVVGPPVLEMLIEQLGFKTALLIKTAATASLNMLTVFIYIERHVWICCPHKPSEETSLDDVNTNEERMCLNQDEQYPKNSAKETVQACNEKRQSNFKQRAKILLKQEINTLCNSKFILLLLNMFFFKVGEMILMTYAIQLAIQSGYATTQQAAFGPTANGVTSVIIGIIIATLSKYVKDPLLITMISDLFVCVCFICLPFATYLPVYFVLMGIFGIGQGGFSAFMMFNVIYLFGDSEVPVAHRLSYLYFAMGLGLSLGPMIVGDAIRITGSIDVAFYIGGPIGIVSILFILPLWCKRSFT